MELKMEKLVFDTESKKVNIEQKYEILKFVPEGDEILRQTMPKYTFNDVIATDKLIGDMITTCKEFNGFGLAANQVGYESSVFVFGYGEKYNAMFNPEIISCSMHDQIGPEGCLSFVGLVLNIKRPNEIVVRYQDALGKFHTSTFTGLTARVISHEIDHLNGIVFTGRAKPLALQNGLKKRNKHFKRFARSVVESSLKRSV
jgi:peptide deformylase